MLPVNFLEDLVTTYGLMPTPRNIAVAADLIGQMFLSEASDFMRIKDARAADLLIKQHQPTEVISLAFLQDILSQLARWNYQVLPYIQELPMRCRAIVLGGQGLGRACE